MHLPRTGLAITILVIDVFRAESCCAAFQSGDPGAEQAKGG